MEMIDDIVSVEHPTILFDIIRCSMLNNDSVLPLGLLFQIVQSLNFRNSPKSIEDTTINYRKAIMFDIRQ